MTNHINEYHYSTHNLRCEAFNLKALTTKTMKLGSLDMIFKILFLIDLIKQFSVSSNIEMSVLSIFEHRWRLVVTLLFLYTAHSIFSPSILSFLSGCSHFIHIGPSVIDWDGLAVESRQLSPLHMIYHCFDFKPSFRVHSQQILFLFHIFCSPVQFSIHHL